VLLHHCGANMRVVSVGRMRQTHVENELGKVLKNCLCGVSCRDTIKVANRSRVSCGIDSGFVSWRREIDRESNGPLEKASRVL
jgi:hypothetical protein